VALASLAAAFARASFPYELFVHLRAHYLAVALLCLVGAALLRAKRVLLVSACVAMVNLIAILAMQAHVAPWLDDDQPADLVVVWGNVQGGQKATERLTQVAREIGADSILLGELNTDIYQVASGLLPEYVCHARDAGWYSGTAFVRHPCEPEIVRLEPSDAPGGETSPVVSVAGIKVLGLHANVPFARDVTSDQSYLEQARAAERIRNRRIADATTYGPDLVLGDFNASPWAPPIVDLQRQDGYRRVRCGGPFAATWPTWAPFPGIVIDHAFVRDGYRASCKVGPSIGSDHLPIIVRVAKDE
jgi:endonuclease/exonuclease/phosphatase (EEP) superfamily protein YafD